MSSFYQLIIRRTFAPEISQERDSINSRTVGSRELYLLTNYELRIMQMKILRVVRCGDAFMVKSEKSEDGQLKKRNLVLKELGGKFENEYAVSVLGNAASLVFSEGDLVVVTLRFQTREYNGQVFQDITVTDIYPINR